MKARLFAFLAVLVIGVIGLYVARSSGPATPPDAAPNATQQPTAIPENIRIEKNLPRESDPRVEDKPAWTPPRTGRVEAVIVDEELGPRWRAVIVEARRTRFRVLHYIVKSANQTDAEYFSLLKSFPDAPDDLEIGTRVRVHYRGRTWNKDPGYWELKANKIVRLGGSK